MSYVKCHMLLIVEDFCFTQHQLLPLHRFRYKPSLTLRASLPFSCIEHAMPIKLRSTSNTVSEVSNV